MTAEEFLDARKAFEDNRRLTGFSRHPDAARLQNEFRADWISERAEEILDDMILPDEAAASAQAREEASALAALHEPDGIAGGFNNPAPVAMGDSGVNSSIGSSWNYSSRAARMDAAAQQMVLANMGDTTMNIKLAPT